MSGKAIKLHFYVELCRVESESSFQNPELMISTF